MVLRDRLKDLNKDILIKVVYLTNRFIRHDYSWDYFLRQLQQIGEMDYHRQTIGIVRALIDDIEAAEGTDVHALSPDRRRFYILSFHTVLMDKIGDPDDPEAVEAGLAELRLVR